MPLSPFTQADRGVGAGGGPRGSAVRVLDVGCGANLIYPLLGAAMHGWAFVAADVTAPALEWAGKNRAANPHLSPLIEVRRSGVEAGGAGAAERFLTHRDALPLSSLSTGRAHHLSRF